VTTIGDAARLQQVISNLLSNAIKFTPKGGRINVRLNQTESHAVIAVTDTGRGISGDFLPRVFEPFQQADGTEKRQFGGLGLGLSIVRSLVELHGGTVSAQSPGQGQGATFTVSLPLKVPQKEIAVESEGEAAPPQAFMQRLPSLHGVKVLVVDDEPSAREVITAALRHCGAQVTAATSAAEAIESLKQFPPDVLVSDIGMPYEDGYELIAKIRSLGPEQGGTTPAVALTAYARTEDRLRALAAGFQTHVPKPVEPAELALVITSLLERSKTAVQKNR
jgi:CheY-like chemotaxis protein